MEGLNTAFFVGVASVLAAGAAALGLWRWWRSMRARPQPGDDFAVLQAAVQALGQRVSRLESARQARPDPDPCASPEPAPAPLIETQQADEIAGLARRIDALRSGREDADAGAQSPVDPLVTRPDADLFSTALQGDDLTRIDGIDSAIEQALNAAGFRSFRDIVSAKPDELVWALAAAGPRMAATPTRRWAEQARRLADARDTSSD